MTFSPSLLVLTRPRAASERTLRAVEAAVGRPVAHLIAPLMRLDVLGPLPAIPEAAELIFSSEAGVSAYAALGGAGGWRAWCVGPRTAEVARQAGFEIVGVAPDAARLVAAIESSGPFVHLHGVHTRGDIAARLTEKGQPCTGAAIYDQVATPPDPELQSVLDAPQSLAVPLYSPRSAALFSQHYGQKPVGPLAQFVLLSPAVDASLSTKGGRRYVVPQPTGERMVSTLAKLLCDVSAG